MEYSVTVTLMFKKIGASEWNTVRLTPDEYFDLDDGETPDADSVPKHQHAIDYIGVEASLVQVTVIKIHDAVGSVRRSITETFWNDGRNRIIEVRDVGPQENLDEMIIDCLLAEHPPTWEVLRIVRKEGMWEPVYHVMITQNTDGSQSETKIHPPGGSR